MSKALQLNPFPKLTWDGWDWRGTFAIPWISTAQAVELAVGVQPMKSRDELDAKSAPAPGEPQITAFRNMVDPASPMAGALLGALHEMVSEMEGAGLEDLGEIIEVTNVTVFHTAFAGESYVAFNLECLNWEWGYEHGIGVILHRARVAYTGFAEAANESEAAKDLRRQNRAGGK